MGLRVTRAVIPEAAMAGAPGPVWLPLLARTGRTDVEAEVCSWFGAVVERWVKLGTEASRWVMVMGWGFEFIEALMLGGGPLALDLAES